MFSTCIAIFGRKAATIFNISSIRREKQLAGNSAANSRGQLLLSPILVRVLDSGEIYHFCCLKVTHGFIDGVEWRLFRGANTSLCLMIERKRATLPLTPVQKDDSAIDAQYASRPFSFSPASLQSDSCTAITTAMIRFPLVSSSSAVLTATCRDLKALKDGSCGNIVW